MKTTEPEKRGRGRPATGQTPKRYFRMADDDWAQIEAAAESAETTISEWVREVLLRAAKRAASAR